MALKISIPLCTFNSERYLSEQLESLAGQVRPPDELVVCDDGSTDMTASLVEDFARRVNFPVLFCVNTQRLGVTANFDRAISLCSGDVIMPCDHDDIWESDKIAALERHFIQEPQALLVFSDLAVMTADGKLTGQTQWGRLRFSPRLQARFNSGQAFAMLLRYNVVTGAAMAFRSSLRSRILPIPAPFLHDEWIGLVAAATGRVTAVDQAFVRYRQHPGQSVGSATAGLAAQYRYARARMDRSYFLRMVERAECLCERLSADPDQMANEHYLQMVREKLVHAGTRVKMRDRALLRWPLAAGEAVRGRYGRFGYGLKSLLQDLFL